jgi:oligopeptide transport system ATP-binding protein
MYARQTMDNGTAEDEFKRPTHTYTQGLLKAIPRLDANDEKLSTIAGNPPNLLHLPAGCPFQARCDFASDRCLESMPALQEFAPGQLRACHKSLDGSVA